MSHKIRGLCAACAFVAVGPFMAASPASANVLSLICSDTTGGYNFWVDFGARTVTQGFPWANGSKGYGVFPATITGASVAWSEPDGGRTSLDRRTGRMSFFAPGVQVARYFQCSKGSTPRPVTRF